MNYVFIAASMTSSLVVSFSLNSSKSLVSGCQDMEVETEVEAVAEESNHRWRSSAW
jgi:hypothetical protein